MQNHVEFVLKAPYASLNRLTEHTKSIWVVFHGYGQLAEHFIKRFDVFDSETTFIVAPQGLSKFYLLENFTKVGASWMTKEDRLVELENQRNYFDAVMSHAFNGFDLSQYDINFLGFSQGVSMMARMAAHTQLPLVNFVAWAGGFPPELESKDFDFLSESAHLKIVLGDEDQFFKKEKYQAQIDKMESCLGLKAELNIFQGKHEVKREVLKGM